MDREVEPCDDFYDFACGGFLKSTIIPDDKTTVNTFTGISDDLQNQLRTSIEEKSPLERAETVQTRQEFVQSLYE
uniref:Neprilysin n=1 Tax=Apis cerana TaxID=7461 RepID=V9IJ66_APICE